MNSVKFIGKVIVRLRKTAALRWLWRVGITVPVRWRQTGYIIYVDLFRNFRFVADQFEKTEVEERKSFDVLIERMRPRVFWDVGANVGLYTLHFLSRVRDGSVVAFEPDQRNVDLLTQTILKNRLGAVKIMPQAVGDRCGEAKFFLDDITGATGTIIADQLFITNQYGQAPKTTTVKLTTLDDEFRSKSWPDIIKIDVEGAELDAMEGGRRMLAECLPVVMYEASLRNFVRTRKLLETLGYQLFDAKTLQPIDAPANNVIALHCTKHFDGRIWLR